ncbi:MAG: putative lipid II flippase FtsW [Actinomycetota bacterium]|nr:putative lipid II flippase FtsW [Actinomycetota bacterium]
MSSGLLPSADLRLAGGSAGSDAVPLLQRPLASYYLVLGSSTMLICLGLVMVLSASSVEAYTELDSSFSIFQKQATFALLGVPVMIVAARLPVNFYRRIAYPALLASLAGLVLVLIIGHEVDGGRRWIRLGPIMVQPSEPAKLALALYGAHVLTRKSRLLHYWKHLLVPVLPAGLVVATLVMLQPDLGTTIVAMLVVLALLWVVGAPLRLFGALVGGLLALTVLLIIVEPYRMRRITGFLDPFATASNEGHQAVQGMYAFASGGWWGVGLGASRQKWDYLPNQYTDFIYAIIGEELGLFGSLVVLVLFGLLGYGGIRIARRTSDPFVRLATAGIIAWIVGQGLINMCTVVGLLPITGIPLPMVSYGGTSMLTSMFALGMLLSFARTEPGAAQALASRPTLLRRALSHVPPDLTVPGRLRRRPGRGAAGRTARPARTAAGSARPAGDGGSRRISPRATSDVPGRRGPAASPRSR